MIIRLEKRVKARAVQFTGENIAEIQKFCTQGVLVDRNTKGDVIVYVALSWSNLRVTKRTEGKAWAPIKKGDYLVQYDGPYCEIFADKKDLRANGFIFKT